MDSLNKCLNKWIIDASKQRSHGDSSRVRSNTQGYGGTFCLFHSGRFSYFNDPFLYESSEGIPERNSKEIIPKKSRQEFLRKPMKVFIEILGKISRRSSKGSPEGNSLKNIILNKIM